MHSCELALCGIDSYMAIIRKRSERKGRGCRVDFSGAVFVWCVHEFRPKQWQERKVAVL